MQEGSWVLSSVGSFFTSRVFFLALCTFLPLVLFSSMSRFSSFHLMMPYAKNFQGPPLTHSTPTAYEINPRLLAQEFKNFHDNNSSFSSFFLSPPFVEVYCFSPINRYCCVLNIIYF